MSYDYITKSKDIRQGAYNVSEERILELFGTQKEYYNAIAKAFYTNPSNEDSWLNKETLNLDYAWINNEDRNVRKNVWGELKTLFHKISINRDITNKKKHAYDKITLEHFLLFMILFRIRTRVVRISMYYSI